MTRSGADLAARAAPPGSERPGAPTLVASARVRRAVIVLSLVACGLGLFYGAYRGYYALGGSWAMIGVPASSTQWLLINRVAAVAIIVASLVPLVAIPLWDVPAARPVLLVLFSIAAVGLVMHALIDEAQRLLHLFGLAGRLHIDPYRFGGWRSVNFRLADLEDILFNEPWFLVEGALCGALVWLSLPRAQARSWWLTAAAVATAICVAAGLLSATGVIGTSVVL